MSNSSYERFAWWQKPMTWTLLRCVLGVPCLIALAVLMAGQSSVWLGWPLGVMFGIVMATDHLDGRMARAYDLKSDLGGAVDQWSDKLMSIIGFFLVSHGNGFVPGIEIVASTFGYEEVVDPSLGRGFGVALAFIVLIREFWTTGLRQFDEAAKQDLLACGMAVKKISSSPKFSGKMKVWVLSFVLPSVCVTVGASDSVLRTIVACIQVFGAVLLVLVCVYSAFEYWTYARRYRYRCALSAIEQRALSRRSREGES